MKTYTTTKEKKSKKSLLALIIGLALIACAIIITLCVTLTGPSEPAGGGSVIPPNADANQKYVMPLEEYELGKDFSDKLVYNQTLRQWRTHNGVDFLVEKGADVFAVMGGKVIDIEKTTLEGTVITIEQTDGIVAIYKSLAPEVNVEKDAIVKTGDVIGKVDANMPTEKKEGTHLHLEMKKNGEFVSPLEYLPEGADK